MVGRVIFHREHLSFHVCRCLFEIFYENLHYLYFTSSK